MTSKSNRIFYAKSKSFGLFHAHCTLLYFAADVVRNGGNEHNMLRNVPDTTGKGNADRLDASKYGSVSLRDRSFWDDA